MEIAEEKLEEQATREAGALEGVRGTISVLNQNRRRVPGLAKRSLCGNHCHRVLPRRAYSKIV